MAGQGTSATRDGKLAETAAADHLEQHGLRILARNVRCRGGEVDIIAEQGQTIIFVEVRLRTNDRFGSAAESITIAKQQRVGLAARHWLAGEGQRYGSRPCRFDAVLLKSPEGPVEWVRDAFSLVP